MAAAVIATNEYRLIPGRLRISVKGLRQNPKYAQHLMQQLLGERGIQSVTANPLTGRALIHFDTNSIGLSEIQRLILVADQAYFTPEPALHSLPELT
ncbi:MAG: kdpB 2, partial [Sporomusa sp.]|nr:kdpB 2 [Sporomusa sp.]